MTDTPQPLSSDNPVTTFACGDLLLEYRLHPETGLPELSLLPTKREGERVLRRSRAPLHPTQANAEAKWNWHGADRNGDCLVHLHVRGDDFPNGFLCGHSMRHSATTRALRLRDQTVEEASGELVVRTRLLSPHGLELSHEIRWTRGAPGLRCDTSVTHAGTEPLVLEHLSSFALNGISPFAGDDQPGRLRLHRFRSSWSLEGRHVSESFEDLHLERSWAGYGHVNLRFGQTGSQPVRGYFPFAAIEDRGMSVLWGAQIAWHGSWQLEVHRREDPVTLAGSHADFDFGQWSKTLQPGETLRAPTAILACVSGDIDDLCHALIRTRAALDHPEPESERSLPILFNEWCSTWGNPTLASVTETVQALADTPTGIFVIDDGWAKRPGTDFQTNGDWIVDEHKFPGGIGGAAEVIRAHGLVPGIWFEFEVCNRGNPAFNLTDHHLTRHGKVLTVGSRRFWDFRDPWTFNYLREKVVALLKDNGFGYLKVDYNDSIGIGCDVPDDPHAGLGEGLRQHLLRVRDFFLLIREEVPDIRIENCSSGGHRMDPGMVGLTSMSSFSDAHECVEIPIVAANVLRQVPARKNQIWVVLRPGDSIQRLHYGFAATCMGRMAVSGDLTALSPEQRAVLDEAQSFYRDAHRVIRDGIPRLYQQELGKSYRYPSGRQAVRFHDPQTGRILIVAHSFDAPDASPLRIPLPEGTWKATRVFGDPSPTVQADSLHLATLPAFSGAALLLESC